MKEEIEQEDKG